MAYKRKFNQERFDKWEMENRVPQTIVDMANAIAEKLGCGSLEFGVLHIRNRYGEVVGYGQGIELTHCTFSYADGPSYDYSEELSKWLRGLDFYISASYGDNGMDSATNWHDTYWTHELIYKPSETSDEGFWDYKDEDDEDFDDPKYDDWEYVDPDRNYNDYYDDYWD